MPFPTKAPPVSDDLLRAIGRVIVDWNELERAMEEVIWEALKLDPLKPEAGIVTGGLGFRQKREMVERLCEALLPTTLKGTLLPSPQELADLERARNIIAHGRWSGGHLHESVTVFSRQSQKDRLHIVRSSELLEEAAKVRSATEKYRGVGARLRYPQTPSTASQA